MKKVVSISLGSSTRNHKVELNILGKKVSIERIGTDGSLQKAGQLIQQLDGQIDCFGLGGTDLYIYAGTKRYTIQDAAKIANNAQKTPIVDGSGLKNTLERRTIKYLQSVEGIDLFNKKVLLVCAMDRFGMAETFEEIGSEMTYGDLIFALGLPIPIHSLKILDKIAKVIAPIAVQLPFNVLYPTGNNQETRSKGNKFNKYYYEADIIAGDFHFIKKHIPTRLDGKIIITNTVTRNDVQELREKGVSLLVTTTPHIDGRSFGTNVIEAVLIALSEEKSKVLSSYEYTRLLEKINFTPYIQKLQKQPGTWLREVYNG